MGPSMPSGTKLSAPVPDAQTKPLQEHRATRVQKQSAQDLLQDLVDILHIRLIMTTGMHANLSASIAMDMITALLNKRQQA